jgi:hypothetical protein
MQAPFRFEHVGPSAHVNRAALTVNAAFPRADTVTPSGAANSRGQRTAQLGRWGRDRWL